METLYSIYIVLFLISLLFSRKKNVLCCGLVGFAGWEKPDLNKIKILFFLNDTRGGDSCGYYYNKKTIKGASQFNTAYKLLQKNIIDNENVDNFVFVGHARKASVGWSTVENAHPFVINNNLVIAHNGTLENWKDLCDKYEINHKDYAVDSKALGALIDKQGFSILSEYRGYAALLMHKINEPNVLYVYHGASKKYKTGEALEERPMFYMETNEGVYFSSIKEALDAIKDDEKQESFNLAYNRVFKIEYGNFKLSETFVVNREENNLEIDVKKNYYPATVYTTLPKEKEKERRTTFTKDISEGLDIFKETIPASAKSLSKEGKIFYTRNRYFIKDGDTLTAADGIKLLDKDGKIHKFESAGVHPHVFNQGYLMENEAASKAFTDDINFNKERNFAFTLSKYSKYAVINPIGEGGDLYSSIRNRFFLKGRLATTSIRPVFSDRTYVYSEGLLTKIVSESGEEVIGEEEKTKVLELFPKNKRAENLLPFFDTNWLSEEEVAKKLPTEISWAIKAYIVDVYKDSFRKILNADDHVDAVNNMYDIFIRDMVENKFTINDAMNGADKEPLEYLIEALGEDDEWVEEPNVDADIEEKELDCLIDETCKKIPDLTDLADGLVNLQDSDAAQQNAYSIYNLIDKLKKKDNTLEEKRKLALIIKKLK